MGFLHLLYTIFGVYVILFVTGKLKMYAVGTGAVFLFTMVNQRSMLSHPPPKM